MYARLTVKWANTLFGCIAVLMIPIPFILFFWGPKIRSRSRFARMIEKWEAQQEEDETNASAVSREEKLDDMNKQESGAMEVVVPAERTENAMEVEKMAPPRTEEPTKESV